MIVISLLNVSYAAYGHHHHFKVVSVAASPDGKRVAYPSNTGQGYIWMLEDI